MTLGSANDRCCRHGRRRRRWDRLAARISPAGSSGSRCRPPPLARKWSLDRRTWSLTNAGRSAFRLMPAQAPGCHRDDVDPPSLLVEMTLPVDHRVRSSSRGRRRRSCPGATVVPFCRQRMLPGLASWPPKSLMPSIFGIRVAAVAARALSFFVSHETIVLEHASLRWRGRRRHEESGRGKSKKASLNPRGFNSLQLKRIAELRISEQERFRRTGGRLFPTQVDSRRLASRKSLGQRLVPVNLRAARRSPPLAGESPVRHHRRLRGGRTVLG